MIKTIAQCWFKGILVIGITTLVFYLGGVAIDLFDTSIVFRYVAITVLVSLVAIAIGAVMNFFGYLSQNFFKEEGQ